MKKLFMTFLTTALLALVASVPARADRQYTLCDPAKAKMCASLMALYEFNEATDNDRTSETGSASFIELPGYDVPANTTTRLFGTGAALDPNTTAGSNEVYIPRTTSLGGSFTINLWVYVESDGANSSLILSTWDDNSVVQGSFLYVTGADGSKKPAFCIKQSVTDASTCATSTTTLTHDSNWHLISFGIYATPTTTQPYQSTLWIKVDAANKVTATAEWPPQVFLGGFFLGDPLGYSNYIFDQLSVFSGTLSDGEVTWLYNSRSGRAYPFTVNP